MVVVPTKGLADSDARQRVLSAAGYSLGMPADALTLRHEASGRPLLSGTERGVHVSLSHGRGVAALAMTGLGPVGVDVEVERPLQALRLACRFFTDAESAWVRGHAECERGAAFLWLWTHKEAMGKAYGTGLNEGGLARPGPLPEPLPSRTPCRHAAPSRLLRVQPSAASPAVAAPPVAPHVALAVAVLGAQAPGAPVDLRVFPSYGS